MRIQIPKQLEDLCLTIRNAGGRAFLVGGTVRDVFIGIVNRDYDVEVHHLDTNALLGIFSSYRTDLVGESFQVWKVSLKDDFGKLFVVDFSLPRKEKKVGLGHKGFEVTGDPDMGYLEASRRRDFTINSIMYDPLSDEVIDAFGGLSDLENKVLRVVDESTFVEDSLRVLRAMQFAARFGFTVEKNTVNLCRKINLSDLPSERIFMEFEKWLLSDNPSLGLNYFFDLDIYKIFDLDCPPYIKDVKSLLGNALDYTVNREESFKLAVRLCLLTNLFMQDRKHSMLDKLGVYTYKGYNIRKKILEILASPKIPINDVEIRLESTRKDLDLFLTVKMAEAKALNTLVDSIEHSIIRASQLNCLKNPLMPLLSGKDVLELGIPEGERVGVILKKVLALQISGDITTKDEAIIKAKEFV